MKGRNRLFIWLGIFSIALCFIPFYRAWDYGLIDFDDYVYLARHPLVHTWAGMESLRHCFLDMTEGIWMPLTYVSYALDCGCFGVWFGGFHLHSILIHFFNSCLVWWMLSLLFPQHRLSCLLATLIWAIHPLRCESVILISSRKDVLSFFWEALAFVFWIRASLGDGRKAVAQTILSLIFFVLGSMCKPSVMTFPLLCLLIDVFIIRRVRPLRYVTPVIYMLMLGVFAGVQQKLGGATVDIFEQPLLGRILGAAAAYGIYIRNFIWPRDLALQCIKIWPQWPRFWFPGVLLCGALGLWLLRRMTPLWRNRYNVIAVSTKAGLPVRLDFKMQPDPFLAGVLWFSIAIAPMLGIANFGFHAFADRFTYIPAVGFCFVLVFFIGRCRYIFGVVAVVALSVATWRQVGFWENDEKLFRHTLEVDGFCNTFAHSALAKWYFEFPHDMRQSVREYEIAMNQNIQMVISYYHIYVLGLLETGRGDEIAEKIQVFDKTIERFFGREALRKVQAKDPTVEPACLRGYCFVYWMSRLAWMLVDETDLPIASEIINDLEQYESIQSDSVFCYLKIKYFERAGMFEKAKLQKEALINSRDRMKLFQCRFL